MFGLLVISATLFHRFNYAYNRIWKKSSHTSKCVSPRREAVCVLCQVIWGNFPKTASPFTNSHQMCPEVTNTDWEKSTLSVTLCDATPLKADSKGLCASISHPLETEVRHCYLMPAWCLEREETDIFSGAEGTADVIGNGKSQWKKKSSGMERYHFSSIPFKRREIFPQGSGKLC